MSPRTKPPSQPSPAPSLAGPPKLPNPSLRSKKHTVYRAQRAEILLVREKHPGPISSVHERDLEVPVMVRKSVLGFTTLNQERGKGKRERRGRTATNNPITQRQLDNSRVHPTRKYLNCRLFLRDLGAIYRPNFLSHKDS